MFDQNDFDFCLKVLNPDHIMWAQDFPYRNQDNPLSVQTFLEEFDISLDLKEKIAYKTAQTLFKSED